MPGYEAATVEDRVKAVRERVARTAERSGRRAEDIILIAVSKTAPAARIVEALEAGITDFGENRVQEAEQKFSLPGRSQPDLVTHRGVTLHMIGTLQRNKAREAARLFDIVHSIDRPELAQALDRAPEDEMPDTILPVLLQVNYTKEATKSGVSPEELPALAAMVANCTHLRAVGLMTIARMGADEAELHRTFSGMRRLLEDLQSSYPHMQHLSMGMTNDYEIAIEEGATMIRVGRAIFGERR